MRSHAADVLLFAGVAVAACGLWMLAPWLGVTAAGVGLVGVAWLLDRPGDDS